jgi:glycosyltransferase involved in cell wall biosynthesis
MNDWPRITIVTPSFNQGNFIAETVESVLGQNYPNLEHIIMDGGSTDNTLGVLERYSHLRVISESDNGQSNAINKGFRLATGKIWGFLNSDDTLLPGALKRIAQEIAPNLGCHIVMGRCRFVDKQGRFIGIEHPSYFKDHRRVLEVWKGHMIPQPAVFWTPKVWYTCGPLDENLNSNWIDYDLFCRFSKNYFFHTIDQVLATYRLHPESKTGLLVETSQHERLEDCIRISRRYWGSPFSIMYWQLLLSLKCYRFNRIGRSRALYQKAQEASRHRQPIKSIFYAASAASLSPEVAFYVGIYPALKDQSRRFVGKLLTWHASRQAINPQTAAYLDRTEAWEDGWIGPRLVVEKEIGPDIADVIIHGIVDLRYIRKAFSLTVFIDGQKIGAKRVHHSGDFTLDFKLLQPLSPGKHTFEIQASSWWVHHQFYRSGDYRPLAWKIAEKDGMVVS